MKKNGWKVLVYGGNVLSVLPLVAWVFFARLTRNTFRLSEFQGADQRLCMILTAVGVLCWMLGYFCQKQRSFLPGTLAAWVLLVLGLCAWILVLGTQWSHWKQAVAVNSLDLLHQRRLQVTALGNMALCLVPVLALGWDSLKKQV